METQRFFGRGEKEISVLSMGKKLSIISVHIRLLTSFPVVISESVSFYSPFSFYLVFKSKNVHQFLTMVLFSIVCS